MPTSKSDMDLRSELKKYGVEAGPITETTRSVYIKKLKKLKEESDKKSEHDMRDSPMKRRNNTYSDPIASKNPSSPSISKIPSNFSTKSFQTKEHSGSFAKPSSASTVLDSVPHSFIQRRSGFSNDSGDTFASPNGLMNSTALPSVSATHTPWSSSTDRSQTDAFRRSEPQTPTQSPSISREFTRVPTPQRAAGHTPTRKTYVYYRDSTSMGLNSDTDTDDDGSRPNPPANAFSRVKGWLGNYYRPQLKSHSGLDRLSSSRRDQRHDSQIEISDADYSDIDEVYTKMLSNQRETSRQREQALCEAGTGTSPSLLFTPPRSVDKSRSSFSRRGQSMMSTNCFEESRTSQLSQCRSYLSTLNGRVITELVSQVPNMILLSGIFLLCVLTACYFVLRDQHGDVTKMADLQSLVCSSAISTDIRNTIDLHNCLHQESLANTLPVLGTTFDILSRYSGEYHCGVTSLSTPRMATGTAKGLVRRLFQDSDEEFQLLWKNTLFLILNVGKAHFGLVAFDVFGAELNASNHLNKVAELESIQPYFSGVCRVRRFFTWFIRVCLNLLWMVTLILVTVGIGFGIRWVRIKRMQRLEQHNARIRDLVAELVHMLQHQLHENETTPSQPPYLPVNVLHQRLTRKYPDATRLWPEIVRYVYNVETCIGVQEWRGLGETWQWQGGTGWQGSALMDNSQKAPFIVPPSECLKVRNMFSTDSLDERGKRRIKRELLKKLYNCGPIIHIGLDSVGTKGLVYIKCLNAETAGRVYQEIHANYFDGRLLTVKFLRDAKYCLRFPEAHAMHRPLCLADVE